MSNFDSSSQAKSMKFDSHNSGNKDFSTGSKGSIIITANRVNKSDQYKDLDRQLSDILCFNSQSYYKDSDCSINSCQN